MTAKEPTPQPPFWLRGPVKGISLPLLPVAHALLQCLEDLERLVHALPEEHLAAQPGGAASIAFHLRHLAGSTERLFTYARGEELNEGQKTRLAAEKDGCGDGEDASILMSAFKGVVAGALEQLESTPLERLSDRREVGRARLPSTVLGLIFHAAEHAQRHTGQIITTAKILRGSSG